MPQPRVYGTRDHFEHCPFPVPGGGDCWKEPHPASRHGLCAQHWREVVEDWVTDAPTTTRLCPQCYAENRWNAIEWASVRCVRCGFSMDAPWLVERHAEVERGALEVQPEAHGVVYYVQLADLVKIGFSTNLRSRMDVIPHDAILATEPGSMTTERARHRQFGAYKLKGQREWFRGVPELLEHAARIREQHGDPEALADRIENGWLEAEIIRQFGTRGQMEVQLDTPARRADWARRVKPRRDLA